MSGFSPTWLALREPADFSARNIALRAAVAHWLEPFERPVIVDIGCGTGSNLRALAPYLGARQRWRLIDHDANLLQAARENLLQWGAAAEPASSARIVIARDGKIIDVSFEQADLGCGVEALLQEGCDLITAAAFFDLAGEGWIEKFCAAIVAHKTAFYTALTYDGQEDWSPGHLADAAVLAAFHAHQRRDKGLGPAAGPGATQCLAAGLERAGWRVKTAPSPWRLGASDGALIAALADGSAQAASQTGLVSPEDVEHWRIARRKAQNVTIGHMDLFAQPTRG